MSSRTNRKSGFSSQVLLKASCANDNDDNASIPEPKKKYGFTLYYALQVVIARLVVMKPAVSTLKVTTPATLPYGLLRVSALWNLPKCQQIVPLLPKREVVEVESTLMTTLVDITNLGSGHRRNPSFISRRSIFSN